MEKENLRITVSLGIIATFIGLLSLQESILLYAGSTATSVLIGTFFVSALFSTVYFLSLGFELKIRDTEAIQPKKSLKKFGYNSSINTFIFSITALTLVYAFKFVEIFISRPCLFGSNGETSFYFGKSFYPGFLAIYILLFGLSMLWMYLARNNVKFRSKVPKSWSFRRSDIKEGPILIVLLLPILLVGIQETLRPKSNADICKATKIELKERAPIKFNR